MQYIAPWVGNLTTVFGPREENLTGSIREISIPGGLLALGTLVETIDRCITKRKIQLYCIYLITFPLHFACFIKNLEKIFSKLKFVL